MRNLSKKRIAKTISYNPEMRLVKKDGKLSQSFLTAIAKIAEMSKLGKSYKLYTLNEYGSGRGTTYTENKIASDVSFVLDLLDIKYICGNDSKSGEAGYGKYIALQRKVKFDATKHIEFVQSAVNKYLA